MDWFLVFMSMAVFFCFAGLVCLVVHLRYNGPWWCRVLLWLPVLIINIVCLAVNWPTLEKHFKD